MSILPKNHENLKKNNAITHKTFIPYFSHSLIDYLALYGHEGEASYN